MVYTFDCVLGVEYTDLIMSKGYNTINDFFALI